MSRIPKKDLIKTKGVRLTPKQKLYADKRIAEPKKSGVQIAQEVYGKPDKPISYRTANTISVENMQKPVIQIYMDKHISKAKQRITELLDSDNEQIVLASSKDILDRTYGKASQKQESTSVSYIEHVSNKRQVYDI